MMIFLRAVCVFLLLSSQAPHALCVPKKPPIVVERAWDILDREYEPAVIDLLDEAEESVVISFWIWNPWG